MTQAPAEFRPSLTSIVLDLVFERKQAEDLADLITVKKAPPKGIKVLTDSAFFWIMP